LLLFVIQMGIEPMLFKHLECSALTN